MDKFRLATRSLSVGLGAFRRAAVAPPRARAAARHYYTRPNYRYLLWEDITLGKILFLYGGSAVAVECIKYLIDYGGYRSDFADVSKREKELDAEWKLQRDLWKKLAEK